MSFLRFFGGFRGGHGQEVLTLDRPIANFDVAGVPTGAWSSSLFGCLSNITPSCLMSFCCPCIMWAQVVVRAQVPLLISLKNTLSCLQGTSGYRCFIDAFSWASLLGATSLFVLVFFNSQLPFTVLVLLGIITVSMLLPLFYLIGHVRTAFKMKYGISEMPEGCEFWECCGDSMVACACFPCSVSQMARHVFQYDRWDPEIGLFFGDPYELPPLENDARRPTEADDAGMVWTDSRPHPNGERGLGRNNRPAPGDPERMPRAVPRPAPPTERVPPVATVIAEESHVTYNADGTVYKPRR